MDVPHVSVVIPAYNAAKTVGEQLRALVNQDTDCGYEILVCDNGSTDDTSAVVRSWQRSTAQLRLIDAADRRGPAAARNIGAQAADGEKLLFCDADDVVDSGWISAMCVALDHATLVAGSLEGERLNRANRASLTWNEDAFFFKEFIPQLAAVSSNNMGVRRSVFLDIGGFEETLLTAEDIDFSWRLQLAGHDVARAPEAVVFVRKRDGLRAIYRQSHGYGAGDRNLRHRYAAVIAAYESAPAPHSTELTSRPGGLHIVDAGRRLPGLLSGHVRNKYRKIVTIRGRQDLVDRARRLGFWSGTRFGRLDRDLEQIAPPEQLPVWRG